MLRLLALAILLSLVLLPQTPSAAGASAPTGFTAAMNNARPWLMLTPILLSLRLSWPVKLIGPLCLAFLAGLSAAESPLAIIMFAVLVLVSLAWLNPAQSAGRSLRCHNDC